MLPPLRDRTDFAAIVAHLLQAISPGKEMEDAAVTFLAEQSWPGNIRELRNLLTRLTLTQESGKLALSTVEASVGRAAMPAARLKDQTTERILSAHRASGGNLSATARRLGVSRNTVYRALARQKLE